jgi:hypothetical protein
VEGQASVAIAKRFVWVLVTGLSLVGCCHREPGYPISHSNTSAQLRPIAKPHHPKRSKPIGVGNGTTTLKDATASEDELSEAVNDELRKKLVICRGCEDPPPSDRANFTWPNSTASHLTIDQVSTLFLGRMP